MLGAGILGLALWVQDQAAAEERLNSRSVSIPFVTKPLLLFDPSDSRFAVWEFPKIRSTLLWSPYSKDPTI